MPDELQQADDDARLLVEAFVLGQRDASVWESYMNGWVSDVKRRINERWPNAPTGSLGSNAGTIAGVGDTAPGGN